MGVIFSRVVGEVCTPMTIRADRDHPSRMVWPTSGKALHMMLLQVGSAGSSPKRSGSAAAFTSTTCPLEHIYTLIALLRRLQRILRYAGVLAEEESERAFWRSDSKLSASKPVYGAEGSARPAEVARAARCISSPDSWNARCAAAASPSFRESGKSVTMPGTAVQCTLTAETKSAEEATRSGCRSRPPVECLDLERADRTNPDRLRARSSIVCCTTMCQR
jgi:hypothetical protein